ncbi:MAG: hypothetical protein NTY20_03580 [Candidatus Aenigmarchaeota archaeon]|nr:hypothetical protein [Candidatus Aenigmarchaeota archaeon]
MKKSSFFLIITLILAVTCYAFAGSSIDVDASSDSKSIAASSAVGMGGTGIGIANPVQNQTTIASGESSIGNLSAATGPSSASITLEQTFEATDYKRPHIQGGGFPVPGLMNNFGPFFDKSWWNIMTIGVVKKTFVLQEAEVMLEGPGGVTSYSVQYTKKYQPTTNVTILVFKDEKDLNAWISAKKPEELGPVITEGKLKNTSIQVFGQALKDAMKMGATTLLVLNNGAGFENKSSAWNVGIGTAGSIMSGGSERLAGAGNTGAGYTSGKVGTKAAPFFQGYAFKDGVPKESGPPATPGPKMIPQSKMLEKFEKEQSVVK